MDNNLTVDVTLDAGMYRSFSVFDRFIRTGSWRRPVFFLAIFVTLAVVSFVAAAKGTGGAWLLGGVLLGIGLLFPAVHFYRYFKGLKGLIKQFGLSGGKQRFAYTLALDENPRELVVRTPQKEPLTFSWKKVHGVWRRGDLVFIYVEAARAYMLPLNQLDDQGQAALDLLRHKVPAERLHIGA